MALIKHLRQSLLSLLVASLFLLPQLSEACISCFHPRTISHNHNAHSHHGHALSAAASRGINPYGIGSNPNNLAVATTAARQFLEICKKRCLNLQNSICTIPQYNRSLRIAASAAIVAGGMVTVARHHIPSSMKQKLHRGLLLRNELAEGQDDDKKAIPDGDAQADDDAEPRPEADETVMTSAMVATIGVYKNFISPLLPPACRFLPTCSQYGVQAIKEYGPNKGVVLTAWRLLRCSPFGGKGYDPPKWPPVSYTYSSY